LKVNRGQALLELALCAPVLILMAVGVPAVVEVQDASAGLDAATHAAASVAARAPDPMTANRAAHARFAAMVTAYPLRGATLQVSFGSFNRTEEATVASEALVDVGWAGLVLPHRFELRSRAVVRLEPWRTHRMPA
jgi:Flp pilus assembly protein TadG